MGADMTLRHIRETFVSDSPIEGVPEFEPKVDPVAWTKMSPPPLRLPAAFRAAMTSLHRFNSHLVERAADSEARSGFDNALFTESAISLLQELASTKAGVGGMNDALSPITTLPAGAASVEPVEMETLPLAPAVVLPDENTIAPDVPLLAMPDEKEMEPVFPDTVEGPDPKATLPVDPLKVVPVDSTAEPEEPPEVDTAVRRLMEPELEEMP